MWLGATSREHAPDVWVRERESGEFAKCEGQRSSFQESRTTGTRDMTVYIDSTGTTYTHLLQGRHLNYFLYHFRISPPAYLGCPSLLYHVCLSRSQGTMTEAAPCPLVGEIREPCSIGTSSESSLGYRGGSLQYAHTAIIDYAIGRRNRSTSLLSADVCFTRLVG
jgi:hypothetical protein